MKRNNSMMSVEEMIDLYVRYNLGEETYDMMYKMALHGLISRDNWMKFDGTCTGWHFTDDEADEIVDKDDKPVYRCDECGRFRKV